MAYHGTSTEASTDRNVPICLVRGWGTNQSTLDVVVGTSTVNAAYALGGGNGLWIYHSTDNCSSIAAGYFSDGVQLGMRNGDVMIHVVSTASQSTGISMGIAVLCSTSGTAFGYSTAAMILSTR